MRSVDEFVQVVLSEFPPDRLTYQKGIPTFHPENAQEACHFLTLLNRYHRQSFVTGFGNNIDPVGAPFDEMVTIRTDRLNDLMEVASGDFYVTVGSGYPLKEINLRLESHRLFLPHSNLPYVGSVGGALAVNLSADLNGRDVPLKRYFIKAEVVTPEGEIITPGSVCFKSVSGYDIVKLFSGSWGLLGLIVSASFRVLPTTALSEFEGLKLKKVDRTNFVKAFDVSNDAADAVYSRKIKDKFDPNGVLPIV